MTDVDRQIDHMIKFIEQEAAEKIEEIRTKAEEEFNSEKGRLVYQHRSKIMDQYDKKTKQLDLMKKIQHSTLSNQSRLQVLKARAEGLDTIEEEAQRGLAQIVQNQAQYKQLMEKLLVQGLCQLLEPETKIVCKKQDVQLVQAILQSGHAISAYKDRTGKSVNISIDNVNSLPDNSIGGLLLVSRGGKMKADNSLDARLKLVADQVAPQIRTCLYGRNPSRKFDT